MIQQKSDNTAAFNPQVRRYALADNQGITEIVFFPQILDVESGERLQEPQLTYHGSEGQLTFTGDEIAQQQSPLGLLITVVLKPNLDAGQLNLTLVLPPISLAGKKAQEFETIAIKTRGQGLVIDPGGATLTYRALILKGVAQAIMLPFVETVAEPLESTTHDIA